MMCNTKAYRFMQYYKGRESQRRVLNDAMAEPFMTEWIHHRFFLIKKYFLDLKSKNEMVLIRNFVYMVLCGSKNYGMSFLECSFLFCRECKYQIFYTHDLL